jgi:hypothetical protein
MLKISRQDKRFTRLKTPTLAKLSILERADLQEYIYNSPEAFCDEIGQPLLIIAKEVKPSEIVDDRIDLLAVDADGTTVVIELKRGNDKLQLLQAVAYAGMVAKWSSEDLMKLAGERSETLTEFLDVESEEVNRRQRIMLVAEAYDYEVLVAAEWLYEKDVEIGCARVALAVDESTGAEYLTFSQVFPTPELSEQAKRRKRGEAPPPGDSWEAAISAANNLAAADFFRRQLSAGRDNNLRYRVVSLRIAGRRRFDVWLKREFATVEQRGRFPDDLEFWSGRLKTPEHDVRVVGRDDQCVRFRLYTNDDFAAFEQAVTGEVRTIEWASAPISEAASA